MLIDFHTHAFPERIAARAVSGLAQGSGGLIPQTDGTLASLKAEMNTDGVDLSVALSIATNPKQQTNVNNFAIEMNSDDRIIAFGSIHPDAPDALEELERIAAAGLKGVKLHPEYQCFYVNDEKMKPIYKKISELGLITMLHAGQDIGFGPPYHNLPDQLLSALKWMDAPVVAAHWGGYCCGVDVIDKLCCENLWFDTSLGYGVIPKPQAQAIIDKHGPDKILFASDMPWHRPEWELRLINSLDISQEDKEKIFSGNARKLLGL